MNKIKTYLGFAQKSNNCITGQTALKRTTKQLYLILVCESASDNLKDLAKNLANKHNSKFFVLANLASLLNRADIKIAGLTEENLSKAIIENIQN